MQGTEPVDGRALSSRLRRLLLILLALHLALSAYVLWRAAQLTPASDEIDWVQRWRDFQAHGNWTAYLLTPVNLHRLPWTFGLIDLDIRLFRGTNVPLIASGALALGGMAWLLARETSKAVPPPARLPAAVLVVMLALMAGSILDAATPICVNYTHGAAFAVLAIVLAEGERRGVSVRRLAALAVAMIAGLGDAVALAVWPVFALTALRRRDWAWLCAVLAAGGAFLGLYAGGQGGDTSSATHGAFEHPLTALRLSLNFLMLPWTRLSIAYAWAGGLAVLVAGLAAVAWRGGPQASRSERVATGLILFSLGAAAMAGLGRTWGADPLNVPLRYAVLVTPLHAGFIILSLPYADALWRTNRKLAPAACVAVLVLAFAQNLVMSGKVIWASDVGRNLVTEFKAGRRDPRMLAFVYPDFARAEHFYSQLAHDGLFQHELHLKPQAPAR